MSSVSEISDSDYWYQLYLKKLQQNSTSASSALTGLFNGSSNVTNQNDSDDFGSILSAVQSDSSIPASSTVPAISADSSSSSQKSSNSYTQNDYLYALSTLSANSIGG